MGILHCDVSEVGLNSGASVMAANRARACAFKGHSPLSLLDLYQDSEQRHALFSRITPSLIFQLKLNSLFTRCCSAMLQNGLRLMSNDLEHGLDILIRVFEANIKDIEPEAHSGKLWYRIRDWSFLSRFRPR